MTKQLFRSAFLGIFILLFSIILCSCENKGNSIKMKGSDTEVNLVVNLAERYSYEEPNFSIAISGGGSGLGITSLLNGQADIANSSRPLTEEEIQRFKEKNIEIETIAFAEDATAFVVNKDFPLDDITLSDLAKVLDGTYDNWFPLTGVQMPINIYGRQSSSGTFSFVKKKLKIEFSSKSKEMTGNAQIIEGIKVDKSGIGYVGAGYVSNNHSVKQGIKVLSIKETDSSIPISPLDEQAIIDGIYFFQRPLYQFVLKESMYKVLPFINFERGEIGQELIQSSGYYIIE